MAQAGRVLVNPISGERFTFLKTAADTDGKLLQFDVELSAGGSVPGAHLHPVQEERFEVLEGWMARRRGLGVRYGAARRAPASRTDSRRPTKGPGRRASRRMRMRTGSEAV